MDRDGGQVAEVPAPHLAHQLLPAEHSPGVGEQERQEVELAQGEGEFGAVLGGAPGRRVQDETGGAQRPGVRPGPGAAQYGLHAQHEFTRAERLGDVVVRAHLQAEDAVVLVAACRQHDDRHGAALPQPAADLQAVHAGQHQVEDDQVGPVRGGAGERGRAVPGAVHHVSRAVQVSGDDLGDGRVVVHDQNPRSGGVRGSGGLRGAAGGRDSGGVRDSAAFPRRRFGGRGLVGLSHATSLPPRPRERRRRPSTSVFRKERTPRNVRFRFVG